MLSKKSKMKVRRSSSHHVREQVRERGRVLHPNFAALPQVRPRADVSRAVRRVADQYCLAPRVVVLAALELQTM